MHNPGFLSQSCPLIPSPPLSCPDFIKSCLPKLLLLLLLAVLFGVGWQFFQQRGRDSAGRSRGDGPRAFPVETANIVVDTIAERRTFSGTLEPSAETAVAPRIGGRIARVLVELADPVSRGQVVVELDDAEYRQAAARAEADLSVRRARLHEAENRLAIAQRERERARQLSERGISSAADLDRVEAEYLIRTSALQVARAEVSSAKAALETARIRLADTRVRAFWTDGDAERLVSRRHVDEGDTVSPNHPLLQVVEIDPVRAVFYVPERDYARLSPGQDVTLVTDAWPDTRFPATIHRIAPVFREQSRQARVEIRADNPGHRLKPGMFIRAAVTLEEHPDAYVIPESALTRRDGAQGVFLVDEKNKTALWREVTPGFRDADRVEISGENLQGRVVTLGRQLLRDGSPLLLPEDVDAPAEDDS